MFRCSWGASTRPTLDVVASLTMALVVATGCGQSVTTTPPTNARSISIAPTGAQNDPGPKPTPPFPDVDAIGLGDLMISSPVPFDIRFWLTCEWSAGDRVQWLYTGGGTAGYPGGPIRLFGEPVFIYLSNLLDGAGDPYSVVLNRMGDFAPYTIDPGSTAALSHVADWTSGTLTFEHLSIDPSAWQASPAPTPKEQFERPLGGDPRASDLSGSFAWACDPRSDGLGSASPGA